MPKEQVRLYREQTINGQPVHVALSKDDTLLVSFPDKGINFSETVRNFEQFTDAMLMILTYPQPAAQGAKQNAEKPTEPKSGDSAEFIRVKADGKYADAKLPIEALEKGDTVEVQIKGKLTDGIMAIGGETTGTLIKARNVTWELDVSGPGLREKAAKLNGKTVVVTGAVRQKAGIEIAKRTILVVKTLEEG